MNEHTFKNWKKIKIALEEKEKTDCFLYKRACSIVTNGYDPIEKSFLTNK